MASSNLQQPNRVGSQTRHRRPVRPPASHDVQFYEGERFLIRSVSEFLLQGLSAGQRLIVIATRAHRAALTRALGKNRVNVPEKRERGLLTLLDAEATLAQFMSGDNPDRARFRAVVEPLVKSGADGSRRVHVRAYGEMVNLLAQAGKSQSAIRLEALWNELQAEHHFDLLCGYAMSNFSDAADALDFREICRQHAHVAPTERYTQADASSRLLEITLLQQRAQALEQEVERREKLEVQLREAIEDRERSLAAERVARTEAESANRAKNQFLAVMSHELRTPLNAIAGHTQLLELGLHGPVTNAQKEALSRIERSQAHLLGLVNDVLNLARVESGREEYVVEPVEVGPLVDSIVSMVEPLFSTGQLVCVVAERLRALPSPTALADREKLQQILLNLLTNAIKFTPVGGRIAIDAGVDHAAGTVCLEVRDTGLGIPPEKIDLVFEPFVQVATKLSARQDGIGLGLTISRRFARAMQGDLTATNAEGGGASFKLTLPLAPAARP